MSEPASELGKRERPLSKKELQKVLQEIESRMVAALGEYPVAKAILEHRHLPEEQMAETIRTKEKPNEMFPEGRSWINSISFGRGEIAVKSFPEDEPFFQEGFFIYEPTNTLDYRRMEGKQQVVNSNSSIAAARALALVTAIESRLKPQQ